MLQVDPGRDFMGEVTKLFANHKTELIRGRKDIHRDQIIVERFNRTLAERLFDYQYAEELQKPQARTREWVQRLPAVIKALNNEVTRMIGRKPVNAIKSETVLITMEDKAETHITQMLKLGTFIS